MRRMVVLLGVLPVLAVTLARCGLPPPPDARLQARPSAPNQQRLIPADWPDPGALPSQERQEEGARGLAPTTPVVPAGGQTGSTEACLAACRQTEGRCAIGCTSEARSCRVAERQDSLFEYRSYVNRQLRDREPVTRTRSSFDRSIYECRDVDRSCSLSCRGTIDACVSSCTAR